MFGTGSIYRYFNVFWVVGAILPCILYALVKYGGRLSWIGRTLHAPVMLGAMGWLPPATPLSFSTWGIVALIFNHFIKKRFHGWWRQYNYVTAAALDAGLIISTIVIFFAIVSTSAQASVDSTCDIKFLTNMACCRLSLEQQYPSGGVTLVSTTRWYVIAPLGIFRTDLTLICLCS